MDAALRVKVAQRPGAATAKVESDDLLVRARAAAASATSVRAGRGSKRV